ncbi:hypothetical protein ABC977_18125 [Thioalkalicoccus limnaeus]|uniref:Uncharacterized protein n=1 Tax=Thioalkalicoccus limnaeus TaxID=120681 RepID=A0ABV4BJB8_9GAMM
MIAGEEVDIYGNGRIVEIGRWREECGLAWSFAAPNRIAADEPSDHG